MEHSQTLPFLTMTAPMTLMVLCGACCDSSVAMVRSLRGRLCHAADDEQLRIVCSLRGLVMRLLQPGPGYNGGNCAKPE